MQTRPWIFLINPFLTVTKGTFRLMKQIGDLTLAALAAHMQPAAKAGAAEDIFTQLYNTLLPLVQAYDDAYTVWLSQQGMVKGQTKSLGQLLDDLSSTLIAAWDRAIQNVYLPGTPQYMALLPRHRQPFQQGSQQDKITAVGALSLAIGDDAKLLTLKADVNTTHDALVLANATQKGAKSTKSGSSAEVEADRIALGTALYGVLGELMNFYQATPEVIATILPVDILRSHQQTVFSQNINSGETKLVFTRTLADDDHLKYTNRLHTVLQIALVAEKNDAMPPDAFTLQPGEEELVTPQQIGGAKGNRFLIVKNMSATEKGAFTIELV